MPQLLVFIFKKTKKWENPLTFSWNETYCYTLYDILRVSDRSTLTVKIIAQKEYYYKYIRMYICTVLTQTHTYVYLQIITLNDKCKLNESHRKDQRIFSKTSNNTKRNDREKSQEESHLKQNTKYTPICLPIRALFSLFYRLFFVVVLCFVWIFLFRFVSFHKFQWEI